MCSWVVVYYSYRIQNSARCGRRREEWRGEKNAQDSDSRDSAAIRVAIRNSLSAVRYSRSPIDDGCLSKQNVKLISRSAIRYDTKFSRNRSRSRNNGNGRQARRTRTHRRIAGKKTKTKTISEIQIRASAASTSSNPNPNASPNAECERQATIASICICTWLRKNLK